MTNIKINLKKFGLNADNQITAFKPNGDETLATNPDGSFLEDSGCDELMTSAGGG